MKTDAQAIYQAIDRAEAVAHAQAFARRWRAGYPQLVTRLPRHLPESCLRFSSVRGCSGGNSGRRISLSGASLKFDGVPARWYVL